MNRRRLDPSSLSKRLNWRHFGFVVAFLAGTALCGRSVAADPPPAPHPTDRAAWMREREWGVMHHWLADWMHVRHCLSPYGFRLLSAGPPSEVVHRLITLRAQLPPKTSEEWNRLVDGFDEKTLARQLDEAGAGWFLLTIGQNSGHYCAPNATYDRLTEIAPSKLSRRDLVLDVAKAMRERGIRMMVYLPATPPGQDRDALGALDWQPGPHRNAEYQQRWEAVIREWSLRWGTWVDGWWFDGCYWPDATYRHAEEPNFASFAAAARAGNPQAVVAFNPGVKIEVQSEHEDYTAGEIDDPRRVTCPGPRLQGSQWHMLSYLGHTWGWSAEPRFPIREAATVTGRLTDAGGAVTWDIPLTDQGHVPEAFFEQLRAIGRAVTMTPNERTQAFPPPPEAAKAPHPPGNLACFAAARLLSLDGRQVLPPNAGWHVAELGVDGDRSSTAQASDQWPWMYEVDLGETHQVGRVVVRFGRNFATRYAVELSANGEQWTRIAEKTDAIGATVRLNFEPAACRYVRVLGLRPNGPGQPGYQMSIAELEVYPAGDGEP